MSTLSGNTRLYLHTRSCRGFRPSDRPLDSGQEPPLGAHGVTPRRAYTHHGIYAGRGKVLQYGGGLRRGRVEEVPLRRFSRGRAIWIRPGEAAMQDRPEVVRRARSRLGETRYQLLRNNCEHFCEWCVRGQNHSYQVDAFLSRLGMGWVRFIGMFARSLGDQPLHSNRSVVCVPRRQREIPGVGNPLLTNG
jgi:uncharacterized Fe-S cluster protein YjdI